MMTVGIDTYITAADADQIIAQQLLSTDAQRVKWAALAEDDKEVCLRQAAARMEAIPYSGRKYSHEQPLQFPRLPSRLAAGVIPTAIIQAQALEAAESVGMTQEAAQRHRLRAMGITSFTAGRISETYGAAAQSLYSLQAAQLLRRYIAGGVEIV